MADIQFEAVLGKTPYGILEGEEETYARSGGSLPHSSKGRIHRKPIDLQTARLFSTRQNERSASTSYKVELTLADINGDGILDIVTCGSFLLGNGDGTF